MEERQRYRGIMLNIGSFKDAAITYGVTVILGLSYHGDCILNQRMDRAKTKDK